MGWCSDCSGAEGLPRESLAFLCWRLGSQTGHFWFNSGRTENWQAAQFEKLDASEPGCRRVSVAGTQHMALSKSERKGFISRPRHSLSMKEVRTGTETRQGRGGRAGAEAMEKGC